MPTPTSRRRPTTTRPLRALVATAALLTAACARRGAPPAAAADPTGSYTYTSSANGQPISGTITISRTDAGLRGLMTTGVTRDLAFPTVRVTGDRVAMEAATASSRVTVDFTRRGDEISGTWAMGAIGGSLRGRRVAAP